MAMKSGDVVQLDIPPTIAYPLSVFDSAWIAWLTMLDNKKVTLHSEEIMATASGDQVPGWYIDIKAPEGVCQWAPTVWMRELRVGGYCNSCGGIGTHRRMCPAGVAGDSII